MHMNKPLPASFNSPSNPQSQDLVEESNGRHEFYFSFLYLLYFSKFFFFLKLELLWRVSQENMPNAL